MKLVKRPVSHSRSFGRKETAVRTNTQMSIVGLGHNDFQENELTEKILFMNSKLFLPVVQNMFYSDSLFHFVLKPISLMFRVNLLFEHCVTLWLTQWQPAIHLIDDVSSLLSAFIHCVLLIPCTIEVTSVQKTRTINNNSNHYITWCILVNILNRIAYELRIIRTFYRNKNYCIWWVTNVHLFLRHKV